MTSCRQTSNVWSVKLTFSVVVPFYLTKTKNSSHTIGLTKGTAFDKKVCWHQENEGGLGTKDYIFWNYVCMCTYVLNFEFIA